MSAFSFVFSLKCSRPKVYKWSSAFAWGGSTNCQRFLGRLMHAVGTCMLSKSTSLFGCFKRAGFWAGFRLSRESLKFKVHTARCQERKKKAFFFFWMEQSCRICHGVSNCFRWLFLKKSLNNVNKSGWSTAFSYGSYGEQPYSECVFLRDIRLLHYKEICFLDVLLVRFLLLKTNNELNRQDWDNLSKAKEAIAFFHFSL